MTPTPIPPSMVTTENWFAGDGFATILAAVIGAAFVVGGYFIQQRFVRRRHRAEIYSEAVRAVEDYMEAPFLIERRDGTLVAQREITNHISDVQSRLAYYQAQLSIYAAQSIADSYSSVVKAARREAGGAMTAAWRASPTRKGKKVPLGARYSRNDTDRALALLVKKMRQDVYRPRNP